MSKSSVIGSVVAMIAVFCGAAITARAAEADDVASVQPKSVNQVGNGQLQFGMMAVSWTPDGRHVVTTSYGGHTIFWDPFDGRIIENRGQGSCELKRDRTGEHPVRQTALTNCLSPEVFQDPNQDPKPYIYIQAQSLHLSPDGEFAIEVAHGANTTGENLNDTETMIYGVIPRDGKTRGTRGWVHRRPRLWIGRAASRLLVTPADACPAGGCRLSLIDPRASSEQALGDGFGDGEIVAASADANAFAAVVKGAAGARALNVWSSDDLRLLRRIELGAAEVAEIGFDRAGARVFARAVGGEVTIGEVSGGAARTLSVATAVGADAVLLTDIDARTLLLRSSAGAVRLVDFDGRPKAAPPGRLAAVFPRQGAVLSDDSGGGVFLDIASGDTLPLKAPLLPEFNAAPDIDRIDALVGPNLSLSPDGTWLVSAAGWAQAIKSPDQRTALAGFPVLQFPQIWPSPDGRRFAAMPQMTAGVGDDPGGNGIWVFDFAAARLSRVYPTVDAGAAPEPISAVMGWVSDSRLALQTSRGAFKMVDIDTGAVEDATGEPSVIDPYDETDGSAGPQACKPAKNKPNREISSPVKALCYAWEWSGDGSLNFRSTVDWGILFAIYLHPDGTWLAGGRNYVYDTNRSAVTSDVRWLMPNRPWTSLPTQTFMRQLYQPNFMAKLVACLPRAVCFPPQERDLGKFNLVLPQIKAVTASGPAQNSQISVTVEAAEGEDPQAPNGKTRSGVYDLRLYRDDVLVDQWPGPPTGLGEGATVAWRAKTRLSPDPDGVYRHVFTVTLPSGGGGKATLGAYAFNEDRVKSETVGLDVALPATPPRARRTFVLAVGVNDYDNDAWALRFAAPDAALMARTLGRISGDVRPMVLRSQGRARQATAGLIHDALTLLGRTTGATGLPSADDQTAARGRLTAAGVTGARGFETATPDDVVIVTFSGHGWAGSKGEFYLVPSDGALTPMGLPNPLTFISAGQLTEWLRPVDAGETAIIIDACHSAASVQAAGFKPAPLGDPGLGQLAFDKGIRILAASQADALAMEDETLGHGLLTYALAQEALGGAGGDPAAKRLKASVFKGGPVTLDAWLTYAARRLPSLSQAVAKARLIPPPAAADIAFDPPDVRVAATAAQQPQLFDFTGKTSRVTLATAAGAP